MTCIWGAGLLLWNVAMVWIVPRFEQTFKDFKVGLPLVTEFCLSAARLFGTDYQWLLMPLFSIAIAAGVVLLCRRLPRNGYRWAVFASVLLWTGMFIIIQMSVLMPFFTLVDAVSGRGKR
jgi:type II secretory pathway component PulF